MSNVVEKKEYSASVGAGGSTFVDIGEIMTQLGRDLGVVVQLDPGLHQVGRVQLNGGRWSYFRGCAFDLNGMGANRAAQDKSVMTSFLSLSGFEVIPGRPFYIPRNSCLSGQGGDNVINAAIAYAQSLGFPVVVKPNGASGGRLVCVVNDVSEFIDVVRKVIEVDEVFLVQPFITGRDYRVVVLDDEVVLACERLPLTVIGDGLSTIQQLLLLKQEIFLREGRNVSIPIDDFRIDRKLQRSGLTRYSVLEDGCSLPLLDNRNLSTGGEAIDVTRALDQSFRDLVVEIVKASGLRLCGVDLMIDGDICAPLSRENGYRIIEVNSAPALHYDHVDLSLRVGVVRELCRKILLAIVRS